MSDGPRPEPRRSAWSAALVGVGAMAAVDEIVFHQLLAWHHFYDRGTPQLALLSDGLLHAAQLVALVAGGFLLADLHRRRALVRRSAWGGLLLGAGGFQLVDGLVNHKVLRVHQVRYDVELLPYDLGWNLAAVLLLVAGAALVLTAVELVLAALPRAGARRLAGALRSPVVRVVAHPVTAALLDVGVLFVLYLTPLLAATATRPWLHALVLVHMLLAGCLFTWAVLGQGPGPRRPRLAVRLAVLVAAAGAHAYLATLLYARAEIHAHHDGHAATMQQAALWMYYGGDVAEILLAVALLAAWYRRGARRRPAPAAAVAT